MVVPTVISVLKGGGVYQPQHVPDLYYGVREFWPSGVPLRLVVLTDMDVKEDGVEVRPLLHDWRGWWSKLELFRPDLADLGTLFFFDLDTRVVGDLAEIVQVQGLTVLRDFYRGAPKRGNHIGSGLMLIPEDVREEVWAKWIKAPEAWARRLSRGDGDFLESFWKERAARWQDVVPGQVVSYKAHVRPNDGLPDGARVVCFHGHPRPWQLPGWGADAYRRQSVYRTREVPPGVQRGSDAGDVPPVGSSTLPGNHQLTSGGVAANTAEPGATADVVPGANVVERARPVPPRRRPPRARSPRLARGQPPPGSSGPPPRVDYGGATFRPSLLHPERALVLGGGEGVWDEVLAVEEMYGRQWDGLVIGVNDVASHWPRDLDHWCTLHPEKLPAWKQVRKQYGFPGDYLVWGRREQLVDRMIRPWGGGSSGLLAVTVAYALGCQRVVLCGVPMTDTPHFHESFVHQRKGVWGSSNTHWRVWKMMEHRMQGWVKSMSGRTKELLGAPTAAWLEGRDG